VEIFQVVLMGDLTVGGDRDLRIAAEARLYAAAGHRVGLLHVGSPFARPWIAAEIQRCIREDLAVPVDPGWTVDTSLLVVFTPRLMSFLQKNLRRITSARTIVVLDRSPDFDLAAKDRVVSGLFGTTSWAPTNPLVRESIKEAGAAISVESSDWRAVDLTRSIAAHSRRNAPGVGIVGTGAVAARLAVELSAMSGAEVHTFGSSVSDNESMPEGGAADEIAIDRFLAKIDILIVVPDPAEAELSDGACAIAMAAGKIILAPPGLRRHYGPGVRYCELEKLPQTVSGLLRDSGGMELVRKELAEQGALALGQIRMNQLARVSSLIGRPGQEHVAPRSTHDSRSGRLKSGRRHRALFVSPGEADYGEIECMLAVARTMEPTVEPIIAVSEASAHTIESFGFVTEHVTPFKRTRTGSALWNEWNAFEVERLIDAHDIDLVVLFGRNPGVTLARSIVRRSDCLIAWVCQSVQAAAISRIADQFDLVVGQRDLSKVGQDSFASFAGNQQLVDPILLVDRGDLLSREDAATALGLDPARPAVLLGVGAEAWGDIWIVKRIIAELERFPGVEVALFEGGWSDRTLGLWPTARRVKGRPIARYLKAFDFWIVPPDFGTFHEAVALDQPSIFVTDAGNEEHAERGRFAETTGVGLNLRVDRFHELNQMIEVLLSEAARSHLVENCRKLSRGNGTAAAAGALTDLVMPPMKVAAE
jgi:hypothetical protein